MSERVGKVPHKGPNLASIDPQDGARVFLFNPRTDRWQDHFAWEDARIVALTSVGRATAMLLRFNDPRRLAARDALMRKGRYPFAEV